MPTPHSTMRDGRGRGAARARSSAAALDGPSLMARALRALARREYTRAELAQRLAPYAPDADALTAVLDACAARGWLDERRAAQAHVHRRGSALGSARVRAELRRRGVSDDVADDLTRSLAATDAERAQAVWARRFGAPPRDAAERARQMRFLAARGFAADVVRRVVPQPQPSPDARSG